MIKTKTLFFAPEDYPKIELLEPLLINSGIKTEEVIPENYNGQSEALFLPELLVNSILLGNTKILSNYQIELDASLSSNKTIFNFYTKWAGLDKKTQSLVYRCLNAMGKSPKYFLNNEIISLTVEERMYYAILVRLIMHTQNGVVGVHAPTYSLYNMLWREEINPHTVIPVDILSNCLTINNYAYDEKEYTLLPSDHTALTANEYKDLIYLAFKFDANYILLHWENNVHPSKFRALLDMGITPDEIIEYSKSLPEEWYDALVQQKQTF